MSTLFDAIANSKEFQEYRNKKNIERAKQNTSITIQNKDNTENSVLDHFIENFTFGDFNNNQNQELDIDNNQKPNPEKLNNEQASQQPGLDNEFVVEHFVMKNESTWGFNGVAGMNDLKNQLLEDFIEPLKFKILIDKMQKEEELGIQLTQEQRDLYMRIYTEYERYKISIPTGLLLYGPPGTGKTFLTKKLAEEIGAGFVKKSMGDMGSAYQHATTVNIKNFFKKAKEASQNEIIILFLDEIDSLVSARTSGLDSHKSEEVSQFLQEFNSLEQYQNLIVIAATNRPDHLDSAILRSGRFDKKVYIGPPDLLAREEMFRIYIEKEGRPHKKLDYVRLAELTEGYVSSDIEAICDQVARTTSKNLLDIANLLKQGYKLENIEKKFQKSMSGITMKDLEEAIRNTTSSLKMVDMSIYTKWLEKIK